MLFRSKRYLNHDSFCTPQITATDPFPMSANDRAIKADTAMNYRVMDIPGFYQAAPSYHHKTIGGYHAAKLTRYQDLIDRHLGNFTSGNPTEADMRVLDMLNARYIIGRDGLKTNPYAMGPAWLVPEIRYVDNADAEMQALATIDPAAVAVADKRFADALGAEAPSLAPGDTVVMDSYKPNRLDYTVSTRNGGIVVFSEVWFPWGWHATIDGNPADLGRVNYVLRALRVPAGKHQVAMWFDPESVHTTSAIAYGSVTVIYLALALALFFAYLRSQSPDGRIRRRKDRKQA